MDQHPETLVQGQGHFYSMVRDIQTQFLMNRKHDIFLSKIKKGNKRVTDVFASGSFQSHFKVKIGSNYANGLLHRFVVAAPKGVVHKLGRLKTVFFVPSLPLSYCVFLMNVPVYV